MEKTNDNTKEGGKCECGMHWRHGRHFILRWVLGLIVLGIAFSTGVKLGEFKAELRSGYYGYPYMMRQDNYGRNGYFNMPMMPYYNQGVPQTNTIPKAQ